MPLVAGAALGGAAVALGAFGAHAMKAHYDEAALRTFEVGVRYQIYHALALLACGALQASGVRARLAAWLFLIGTALFSGSLYGISLASWTWLGPVTPIGGVALLAGWIALAIAARNRS
ncbi:MAG: DUF423 domain-containing protein [Planctomycetes bacterium]|nr:DUF423 domain-containing protein [Planctomycetota bacterium]